MRIVADQSAGVAAWVANRIPGLERGFGPCAAIGLEDEAGDAVAGFVFHDLQDWPNGSVMQLSLASASPAWLRQRKSIAKAILFHPFYTQGVWKLWTAIPHVNERTERLGKTFGFKNEATLKDQFGMGRHARISRLFRADYDRLYGVTCHRKIDTLSARCA